MGITNSKVSKEANAASQYRYRRTYTGTIQAKYHGSKRNARAKGIKHTLTIDFLKDLWESQRGRCAISGVELGFVGSGWCAASIDRKNPELGYTPSNVQWTCWRVNEAKSNMDNQDFINMCSAIVVNYNISCSTTISKESTSQANGDGSGEPSEMR